MLYLCVGVRGRVAVGVGFLGFGLTVWVGFRGWGLAVGVRVGVGVKARRMYCAYRSEENCRPCAC